MTTFVLKFVFLQTIDQKFGCYFFSFFVKLLKIDRIKEWKFLHVLYIYIIW